MRNLLRLATALLVAAVFMGTPGNALGATVSSVSQWGITWSFDRAYEVGQYANGDWWVLIPNGGSVAITSIAPASQQIGGLWVNGAQVNPYSASAQGYDERVGNLAYSAALNIDPGKTGSALVIASPVSVVKAISPATQDASKSVQAMSVLTVVSTVPNAGDFRPLPYGTDKKSHWNEKNLNYSILRSLAPVANTPSLADVTESVRKFWNEQAITWRDNTTHPYEHQPNYGREQSKTLNLALLSLHLNYSNAQKRDLFVALVQYGLDIYGVAKDKDARWGAGMNGGGHGAGRKGPLILAGLALGDRSILAYADGTAVRDRFPEDMQTFYVTQFDVDLPRAGPGSNGVSPVPYTSAMIGTPEWTSNYVSEPNRASSDWGTAYRWIGSADMGQALMAHLTAGAVAAWNWPAFFDYIDRYERLGGAATPGSRNGIQPFVQSMWKAYRSLGGESEATGSSQLTSSRPEAPTLTGVN